MGVVCSAFVVADLGAAVGVVTVCCCAFAGVLLTGASTISMAMLSWLSMSVVFGDNSKEAMADTCSATTHTTTMAVVRCTRACADA